MNKKLIHSILAGKLSRQEFIKESTPIEWRKKISIGLEKKTVRIFNNRGFDKTYSFEEWKEVKDQFPSFRGAPITMILLDKDGNPAVVKHSEPR